MAWGNAEARTHLELGQQFLIIATHALEKGFANVAATLCINAAIHSKDAICLSEFGSSHRNLPHDMAGKQLRGIPGVGPGLSRGTVEFFVGNQKLSIRVSLLAKKQPQQP